MGRGEHHEGMKRAKFLLLNPSTWTADNDAAMPNATTLRVFPNPTPNANTLIYEVKEVGNVRIELRNEFGKTLKVLVNETHEAGSYNIEVNFANYKDGVYYYTVSDATGIHSQKVIIAR